MLIYNLQYFAEEDNNDNSDVDVHSSGNDNNSDELRTLDIQALADIISDKDKEIEQLRHDMEEVKKINANLIVKVNSGTTGNEKKSFEENLLNMVGAKPRKEK